MNRSLVLLCMCVAFGLFGDECLHLRQQVRVETYRGEDIVTNAVDIVDLVERVWLHYPYFKSIDKAVYTECLKFFSQCDSVAICVAYEGAKAIGVALGILMKEMPECYKKPFVDNALQFDKLYYVGEFGLDPRYSCRGIKKSLYKALENFATQIHTVQAICRWELDPLPNRAGPSFVPKSSFWKKMGFATQSELAIELPWQHAGDDIETTHRAVYMIKSLE